MATARIKTDAGIAYIKVLGNKQGPHQLACELVGTMLARWFGLPTLDFAIMTIDASVDELKLADGVLAKSGPAFVTRAIPQQSWGGSNKELQRLANQEAISSLVVFDTWTRNCDRFPPDLAKRKPNFDNVFLEKLPGTKPRQVRLIAMDHSCCFTCNRDLIARELRRLDWIRDDRLYGLFPAFRPLIRQTEIRQAVARLHTVDLRLMKDVVGAIPDEWEVRSDARAALSESLVKRAAFVAEHIEGWVQQQCWPGQLFDREEYPKGNHES
ncbi:MAG: HipA family kinase [Pirellulaceae bacterium]